MSNISDVRKWINEDLEIQRSASLIDDIFEAGKLLLGENMLDSWDIIRRGSIGAGSQFIQALLIGMGYPCPLDGVFASDSVDALKKYQKENDLIVNGIAGKAVLRKIMKARN